MNKFLVKFGKNLSILNFKTTVETLDVTVTKCSTNFS